MEKRVVLLMTAFSVALALCGTASADPWCGGVPLTTVKEGVVSGNLWFDYSNPMVVNWTKEYTLPLYTDIQWAHLYVSVYVGHMQENRQGRANITFNSVQLGGTPDSLSSEDFNLSYPIPGDPAWANDHCVRVTSDYFMWYDVTDLVEPESDVWVKTWGTGPGFDGRIVVVTLIVAYNDGDSDTIQYWVNRGHDVDTYYWDDQGGSNYIGETNFTAALPSGSFIQNANLTVVHRASEDCSYTFNGNNIPTDPNSTTTPPGENWQGGFSGYNIWYVASLFNSNGNNTLTYDRIGSFYKIVLAFLSVNYTVEPEPVANFTANVTNGPAPLTVQFTDTSTGIITSWEWDLDNNGIIDSTAQHPNYTYMNPGIYTVRLNVTGPGGSDEEIKHNYITVTEPCKPGIEVIKTVWNGTAWVKEIVASVNDTLRFRCIIHNNGTCCNLTNITVTDSFTDSLNYSDNATVNGVPHEPVQVGPKEYKWNFSGPLNPCHNITIEFNASVVKCGSDTNIQHVTAWCNETMVSAEDCVSIIAPCAPDLVITKKWVCQQNCSICYDLTNLGKEVPPGHNTTLYVDGEEKAQEQVPVALAYGQSYIGCFNYTWTYTPPEDNVTVCADNNNTVTEINESNNCLTNTWKCGDVTPLYGVINLADVATLYSHVARGTPISNEWAGDITPVHGVINLADVATLYSHVARGTALNCRCT